MATPDRPTDERLLRLLLAGVAVVTMGAVAITEIVRSGTLSPGVLGLLAGPVALAITAAMIGRSNGGSPR